MIPASGALFRFRIALRTLTRNSGTSLVVISTLAVAIAATTIVYSAIDVLLYFVPGSKVDRLVFVASTDPRPSESQSGVYRGLAWTGVSQPDLADWIDRSNAFEEFAGFNFGTATLTGLDAPRRVTTMRATPNLLRLWGITPAIGGTFRVEDGHQGAEPVAIATETYWRRELAPQGLAVGGSVVLDGVSHTLRGVLSADAGTGYFRDTDLIVPLILDPARAARDERRMFTIARLASDVTIDQARSELEIIVAQLQVEYPRTNSRTGVVVRPHIEQLGGNIPFLMFLMTLVAVLVVTVACANVSSIMLAQGAARRRELAIRSALGAGRLDHLMSLMTENLVLAGLAGVVAITMTLGGMDVVRWLAGDTPNIFGALTLNSRVLAIGLLTSIVVPFGFGLLPAWRASRYASAELKDGGRQAGDASGRGAQQLLVAVQVGLALVLMVQVALLAKTAWSFHRASNGFESAQLLTFRVELPENRYSDPSSVAQFYQQLLTQIESLPGVTSVALTDRRPVVDRQVTIRPLIEGGPSVAPEALPFATLSSISESYLQTMRIPLKQGRDLSPTDLENARPVALVSEEAARRLWVQDNPVGRRLAVNSPSAPGAYLEVVGVVGNVRASLAEPGPSPQIYVPASWYPQRDTSVLIRTAASDPLDLTAAVRARVAELNAMIPIFRVASMEQLIFNELAGGTILTVLLGAVAMVALGLACAGIYGTVAHAVQLRRREIGVRMALGATPGAVTRLVVAQAMKPVVVGGGIGFGAAVTLAVAMGSSISEVDARDPATYAGIVLAVAAVTWLATYVPARRATLTDPAATLRGN